MIGLMRHPDDPDRIVFIPLVWLVHGLWTWLDKNQLGCDELADAQRMCADALAENYAHIVRKSAQIRELSELSDFHFDGGKLDTEIVRGQIASLDRMIRAQQHNVPRLLDTVREGDVIRSGLAEFRLGADGMLERQNKGRPGKPRSFEEINRSLYDLLCETLTLDSAETSQAEARLDELSDVQLTDFAVTAAEAAPELLREITAILTSQSEDKPGDTRSPAAASTDTSADATDSEDSQ